jgi:hypothetical protein
MKRILALSLALSGLCLPTAASAQASSFSLVNGTGADMASVSIRRVGSAQWQPLGAAPPAGKAAAIPFASPDCAFDIRATLAGGATVTWPSVNLCDVKLVILRRNAAGLVWVDYD